MSISLGICIIHDLGEALSGDVPAPVQAAGVDKSGKERADLMELLEPLPRHLRQQIVDLWDEYEAAVSPEARLAKALDKLETIMQHNQGQNPADFDYRFNLEYGRRFTEGDPFLAAVRATLDRETEEQEGEADRPDARHRGAGLGKYRLRQYLNHAASDGEGPRRVADDGEPADVGAADVRPARRLRPGLRPARIRPGRLPDPRRGRPGRRHRLLHPRAAPHRSGCPRYRLNDPPCQGAALWTRC